MLFSIMTHRRILNIVGCAVQQALVSTCSIYNSSHLLIPNPQSVFHQPCLSLGNHKFFSMFVSLSWFHG